MKNENGQFIGFSSPRYTQVPDELFDELLSELSGSELKVLMYVVRRTFGFKRDSDHISLSQMVDGITKKDGTVLDKGTGLHKDSVIKAVKTLVLKGIVLRERKSSDQHGFTPSEYALNVRKNSLSDNPTRDLGGKNRQALPEKSDIQDNSKQDTSITFRNAVKRPVKRIPVDKSSADKREYIAQQILETCRDKRSIAFYRKIVSLLPERVIHEALSQVKEAEQLGRIRERPGAMFTDLIKRKAKELGIEFTKEPRQEFQKEIQEPKPEANPQFESRESSTPTELMTVGRMVRR